MNQVIASISPTHVVFYPDVIGPDGRIEFVSPEFDEPVKSLMARYPERGIPKIEALKGRAITAPLAARAEADSMAIQAEEAQLKLVPENESEVDRAKRIGTSEFEGELKTDLTAKVRIESQHAALNASGIKVDASEQLYATGTRMAGVGYETQAKRAADHSRLLPLSEAVEELRATILAEKRRDVIITAAEMAGRVEMNGKLSIAGWAFNEHAVRSLLTRIDSPASRYVFGLRNRIAERIVTSQADGMTNADRARLYHENRADKAKMAEILAHELAMARSAEIKLRVREATGDCFAALSLDYSPADAPEVIGQIVGGLPSDARGSWSYDPATTSWELRADVWTPTPVAKQAVGEAFRGYVSFRSRDNGGSSLKGGGGIELIRCLNASTYTAGDEDLTRRHIGAILVDSSKMVAKANKAIDALCAAWGLAREQEVMVPADLGPLPLSVALPGFWYGELTARKGELAGVLPGRTKAHVACLVDAYHAERREPARLVKADFAQAWTRYVQDQPVAVRREAESKIADWVVSRRPVRFDADRAESLS